MTTTETTVKNAFFNGKPAAKPADTKKADDQTKAQSFGDVLGKTAQKFEAPKQTTQAVTNTEKPKTQQPDKKNFEESQKDTTVKNTEEKPATVKEKADTPAESIEDAAGEAAETTQAEEPVDEMTADEIANALEQIIGQIKEILGITDEELRSGMEALDLQPCDLLNIDNMAQLVTAISGKDSSLSLIADEGLYAALQEITEMVGVQVENLMENAFKYGDGKEIRGTFGEEDYCQLIEVYTSGEAVAEEEMPHLFDSFYRGTNAGEKEGNGLGLYIGRQLMRKMEGDIFAVREQEGMRICLVFREDL